MIKEFNDENINAQTIHMGIVRDIRNLPDDCPLRNRVQEILNCIWSREKKNLITENRSSYVTC